jgi:hypothetical protein
MPILLSKKVSLMMPEYSGESLLPWKRDVSYSVLNPKLPWRPGRSSGRGVRMLITEPMPPVGSETRPDL